MIKWHTIIVKIRLHFQNQVISTNSSSMCKRGPLSRALRTNAFSSEVEFYVFLSFLCLVKQMILTWDGYFYFDIVKSHKKIARLPISSETRQLCLL